MLNSLLPLTLPPPHPQKIYPANPQPWLTPSICSLHSCSGAAEHLWWNLCDQDDVLHYKFILSSFNSSIFLAKQLYFSNYIESHVCNPSCLFAIFDLFLKPSLLLPSFHSLHRTSQISSKSKLTKYDVFFPHALDCLPIPSVTDAEVSQLHSSFNHFICPSDCIPSHPLLLNLSFSSGSSPHNTML